MVVFARKGPPGFLNHSTVAPVVTPAQPHCSCTKKMAITPTHVRSSSRPCMHEPGT